MNTKYVFGIAGAGLLIATVGFSAFRSENNNPKAAGRPPIAVEAAPVQSANFDETIEVVGSLTPKFQADVKSEYSGIVSEVYVTEWVRVKKGMPLAKLDTSEIVAAVEGIRAGALQADVGEIRANRELERALKLKEYGLVTQQNLDDARSSKDAAAAATSVAKAQLQAAETRLAKAFIRSPMDGVIAYRGVNAGDYVENMGSPKPMFRIVDNRLLDLTVTVPSTKIGMVMLGQPLDFSTDAVPGRTFSGKVMYINPAADETSRSVKVTAEVPNDRGELRGGFFLKGVIRTGSRADVLRVQRAALMTWDVAARTGEVYVVDGQVAHRRPVQTGGIAGSDVEIVSGLGVGDVVITRGAFNVKDGDKISVVAGK